MSDMASRRPDAVLHGEGLGWVASAPILTWNRQRSDLRGLVGECCGLCARDELFFKGGRLLWCDCHGKGLGKYLASTFMPNRTAATVAGTWRFVVWDRYQLHGDVGERMGLRRKPSVKN